MCEGRRSNTLPAASPLADRQAEAAQWTPAAHHAPSDCQYRVTSIAVLPAHANGEKTPDWISSGGPRLDSEKGGPTTG